MSKKRPYTSFISVYEVAKLFGAHLFYSGVAGIGVLITLVAVSEISSSLVPYVIST